MLLPSAVSGRDGCVAELVGAAAPSFQVVAGQVKAKTVPKVHKGKKHKTSYRPIAPTPTPPAP